MQTAAISSPGQRTLAPGKKSSKGGLRGKGEPLIVVPKRVTSSILLPMNRILAQSQIPDLKPWITVRINNTPAQKANAMEILRKSHRDCHEVLGNPNFRRNMFLAEAMTLVLVAPNLADLGLAEKKRVTFGDLDSRVRKLGLWFCPSDAVSQVPPQVKSENCLGGVALMPVINNAWFTKSKKAPKPLDPKRQPGMCDHLFAYYNIGTADPKDPTNISTGKVEVTDIIDPSHRIILARDVYQD